MSQEGNKSGRPLLRDLGAAYKGVLVFFKFLKLHLLICVLFYIL